MTQKITVELTMDEANDCTELFDIATRAGGMKAAKKAIPLTEKILAAARLVTPVKPEQKE